VQTPGAADSGPHATTATALLSGAHGGATALLRGARGGGRGPPLKRTRWRQRPSSGAHVAALLQGTDSRPLQADRGGTGSIALSDRRRGGHRRCARDEPAARADPALETRPQRSHLGDFGGELLLYGARRRSLLPPLFSSDFRAELAGEAAAAVAAPSPSLWNQLSRKESL
jgi:hypothetical protein